MHQPGTRTEDLAAAADVPTPHSRDRTRRFGIVNYCTGAGLCSLTVLAALTTAILTDNRVFTADGKLFALLALVALTVTGASLTLVGGAQTQHHRTRGYVNELRVDVENVRKDISRNRRRLDQLADEVHELAAQTRASINRLADVLQERGDQLGPIVEALPEALAATTSRLDQLGCAMGTVAEHLPDALLSQHWKGFNAAVREGLTLTGTEGQGATKRRPPHIGLVPPGRDQ